MTYRAPPPSTDVYKAVALRRQGFSINVISHLFDRHPSSIRNWLSSPVVTAEFKRIGPEAFDKAYKDDALFDSACLLDKPKKQRVVQEVSKPFRPAVERDPPSSVIERQIKEDAEDWEYWLKTNHWPKGKPFPYGKAAREGLNWKDLIITPLENRPVRGRADVSAF